jgi:hypothetical protein
VVSLDAGAFHACAALVDERVFCWGRNSDGQLGNGVIGNLRRGALLGREQLGSARRRDNAALRLAAASARLLPMKPAVAQ